MMTSKSVRVGMLAAALLTATSLTPAAAVPVTFFGEDLNGPPQQDPTPLAAHPNSDTARANFFSNLTGVGTENFESLAVGATNPALSFPGAGTASLTGSGSVQSGNDGVGRYPISGKQYYFAGAGNFGVTFSSPIAAFGFYGVDIGDYGAQLSLTLTDVSSNVITVPVPHTLGAGGATSGSILYFGFYDTTTQYTSVAFNNNLGGGDNFGFDDFSIGSLEQVTPTVPEPASMLLLGTGLLGYRLSRRRRR